MSHSSLKTGTEMVKHVLIIPPQVTGHALELCRECVQAPSSVILLWLDERMHRLWPRGIDSRIQQHLWRRGSVVQPRFSDRHDRQLHSWASGIKPALQCSAEASGSGPVAIVVGGAQFTTLSSDSCLVHRPDLWPYSQVVKDLSGVEAADTVLDELNTSSRICCNPVQLQKRGTVLITRNPPKQSQCAPRQG